MIMIIDNYDSFTYNLYQYIGELKTELEVYRNDEITIEEIKAKKPSHIIISPGPGYPKDAGISIELIKELGSYIPILGVCLGHQAIGEAYGGNIIHAVELKHGKATNVILKEKSPLFDGIDDEFPAGRYHSLVIQKGTVPDELQITAECGNGEIMAVQHRKNPVFGIQFHPESVLTPNGKQILRNFLNVKGVV